MTSWRNFAASASPKTAAVMARWTGMIQSARRSANALIVGEYFIRVAAPWPA